MTTTAFQFPPAPPPPAATDYELNYEMIKNWALLSMEPMGDRLERYSEYFAPSVAHLRRMVDAFEHELELGLEAHARDPGTWGPEICSFKMLDSCIHDVPSGQEKGIFYALDFGGTNFRVVRTELAGDGTLRLSQYKRSLLSATDDANLPKGLLDAKASATQLFDFFGGACRDFMTQAKDLTDAAREYKAGFTFSFPCAQSAINSAVLMEWTKGFETGRETQDPVEGLDVVELLNAGFERFGVPLSVSAVLNDTVGTMLAGSYEMDHEKYPPCLIGLILGTGVNACYFEKDAKDYNYTGRIINIECGNFNRELPSTNVDLELDFAEVSNRGRQRLEKMISGAYLGEVARRAIVKVLQNRAPSFAWKPYSLSCENLSTLIHTKPNDPAAASALLLDMWHHSFEPAEVAMICRIGSVVVDRAAALAAVIIGATARKTRRLQPAMGGVTCAIDGSLYKCIPYFRTQVRARLNEILGVQTANLIRLIMADDGSGKGAAICAGSIARMRNGNLSM